MEAEEVEAEEVEAEEVEAEEVEAEEVGAEEAAQEEDKQTPLQPLLSDSAETPQKYSQEKEKRRTASSPNSNTTTWPISEWQSSTHGSADAPSPRYARERAT